MYFFEQHRHIGIQIIAGFRLHDGADILLAGGLFFRRLREAVAGGFRGAGLSAEDTEAVRGRDFAEHILFETVHSCFFGMPFASLYSGS